MERDHELDVATAGEDAGQGGNLPADAPTCDGCGEDVAAVWVDDAVVAGQLEEPGAFVLRRIEPRLIRGLSEYPARRADSPPFIVSR